MAYGTHIVPLFPFYHLSAFQQVKVVPSGCLRTWSAHPMNSLFLRQVELDCVRVAKLS